MDLDYELDPLNDICKNCDGVFVERSDNGNNDQTQGPYIEPTSLSWHYLVGTNYVSNSARKGNEFAKSKVRTTVICAKDQGDKELLEKLVEFYGIETIPNPIPLSPNNDTWWSNVLEYERDKKNKDD